MTQEEKYLQLKQTLSALLSQNDALSTQLRSAYDTIMHLKQHRSSLLSQCDQDSDISIDTTSIALAKPQKKKQKLATVTASIKKPKEPSVRKFQDVARTADGSVLLPLNLGILTCYSLGVIDPNRDTFHNARYIYPIGYTISRPYLSMIDPNKQTNYTCRVIDGGDGPKFIVEAEDQQDKPLEGNTPTGPWTIIVRVSNAIRKKEHSNAASGPDYFGFSHPTIQKLIQDLPRAEACKNYVMQKFEVSVGKGRKRSKVSETPKGEEKEIQSSVGLNVSMSEEKEEEVELDEVDELESDVE